MKKILGIVGSPRRNGNTHVLVSQILSGAKAGGAATETVFLKGLKISECDGCLSCWKKKHACSKADDMIDLYPKIVEADAIVLGTPVYWFGPTALMKGFIDRMTYFCSPESAGLVKSKPVVIAVPFADTNKETASLVVRMFERSLDYLEMRLIAKVVVPGVMNRGEVRAKRRVLERCIKVGQRLAKGARKG